DGEALAGALEAERLPGAAFRPIVFVPQFQKWAGRRCAGIALHVLDPGSFLPVRTGVAILCAAKRLAPTEFAWRAEPYAFVSDRPATDVLTGSAAVGEGIEAGAPLDDLTAGWEREERDWRDARRDLLLYS